MPLRVAVIGVGRWGRNHVRVLKELEREGLVQLVALHDVDRARALEVAKTFGVPHVAESLRDLGSLGVEAVVIAVPIDALSSVSKRVAELGMHALIEKPVATSSRDVEELIKAFESRSLVAMPGFIMRFSPVVQELRSIALEKRVHYAVFRRLSRRPPTARRFSILLDLTIHDIDLCRYVLNPSEDLWVEMASVMDLGLDKVVVAMLSDGVRKCLIHTDGLSLAKVREIELVCEEVFVRVNTDENTVLITEPSKAYTLRRIVGEEPLKAEDRAFIEKCLGKNVEIPTLQDAVQALRIAETILMMPQSKTNST